MKKLLNFLYICILCTPAIAAPTITYQELINISAGDSSPKSAIGKVVTITNAKLGEFGYAVNKADEATFLCDSGDPSLVKRPLKSATFKGTTVMAQGYQSLTIWNLKDCQQLKSGISIPDTGITSIKDAHLSNANTGTSVKRTYLAGDKRWLGSVNIERYGKTAKISIYTSSAGGMCDAEGIAKFTSPVEAIFTDSKEPSCQANLTFTNSSVRVISSGCEVVCGAVAPGLDHTYKLKN